MTGKNGYNFYELSAFVGARFLRPGRLPAANKKVKIDLDSSVFGTDSFDRSGREKLNDHPCLTSAVTGRAGMIDHHAPSPWSRPDHRGVCFSVP